jgi:hypothetical protein
VVSSVKVGNFLIRFQSILFFLMLLYMELLSQFYFQIIATTNFCIVILCPAILLSVLVLSFFHVNSLELSLYDCVICEYSLFFFFLPNAFPLSSVVMSSTNSKFPRSLFPLLFIYFFKKTFQV